MEVIGLDPSLLETPTGTEFTNPKQPQGEHA